MENRKLKLPIGIQTFETIRTGLAIDDAVRQITDIKIIKTE